MPTDSKARLTQHELRKMIVQFLYSLEVRPEQDESKLAAYVLDGHEFSEANQEFFDDRISNIREQQKMLDVVLSKYLMKTWSMDRLTAVDRTILRLGAYEILNSDLPDRIAIDEAINLTKDFSDEAASKLVNGILTNLIKKDED